MWETIDSTNKAGKKTSGLVFAHPNRLEVLAQRGHLTLFDSSHKLNLYDFNVFTFMCRNQQGIWIPGGHCLVEHENSDILRLAMQKLKFWTSGRWKMAYALTDDSAVEQRAVKNSFPSTNGDKDGHLKGHILCTVHSERTLKRRFGSLTMHKCLEELHHAMYCCTEASCISHIYTAIEAVPEGSNHDKEVDYIH